MRIRRIAVDGYGRLTNRTIELEPGLQIIVGPNEQGKTTLRSFVSDMLYGQKRSLSQRLYDEANELRCPWENPDIYGGRLVYHLDNGRDIEVYRRFDRKHEVVQVFDLTLAKEITAKFEQFRNREPNFAQTHLGLTKEVFVNACAIGHMTLEGLGDDAALDQIREKLLSLADTGEENHSADAAMKRLEARVAAIGQPSARTRPLPAARARLVELDREKAQALALRRGLEQTDAERHKLLDEIETIRRQVTAVDRDLETLEHLERVRLLQEAEKVAAQIDEATPKCFALRDAAEFPVEQRPDLLRAEMALKTAQNTLDRLQQERAQRFQQVQAELAQLPKAAEEADEIPEEYDHELTVLEGKIRELRARLEEAESGLAAAERRLAAAESELGSLPDYNRLADDPLTWLNQLANAFEVAQRVRDEEGEEWRALEERIQRQRDLVADSSECFSQLPDFENAARDYEVKARMREEQMTQLESKADELQVDVDDLSHRLPELTWLTLFLAVVTAVLLGVAALVNSAVYVASVLAGLTTLYFLRNLVSTRRLRRMCLRQLEEAETRVIEVQTGEDPQSKIIEGMIAAVKCQSIRELEAVYDNYRKDATELAAFERAGVEQEIKAREAKERVTQMFQRYCQTFEDLGIPLEDEKDVASAAGRATARYQSYRDAKMRVAENREQIKKRETTIEESQIELEACRKQYVDLGLKLRQMMREKGYPEESKHDDVLGALRSYRIRSAQVREKRRVIQQGLSGLNANIDAEQLNVDEYSEMLARFLNAGKVETVEQWHARAEQAEEYRQARQVLDALNQQLQAVLRGRDLRELRAAVEAVPAPVTPPQENAQELKRRRENLGHDLNERMKEERALYETLTERSAGMRALNEIEEEQVATERRANDLEFELNATSCAMTMVEQIARDKHSRIAPKIAAKAGGYLKEITDGAYEEILVDRELRISVRIPQLHRLQQDPERVLSKGTVDQIYLALRLAMVQCITETGESIPMLLDDPFPNYDDERLQRAMKLLAQVSQENQILLFTCREDVVRAAKAAEAPVIEI